ncbi:MAG: hypothetical protein RBU37_10635 [Myxococcota bacterium]|jgi:hypothetical protein|nr:hypothetical protein [Myxococcota bacterium]
MSTKEQERWSELLTTTKPYLTEHLSKPVVVFFLEAESHKKFVTANWDPAPDGSRPGLSSAASLLDFGVVDELDSLLILGRDAHAGALFLESDADQRAKLVERARILLLEIGEGCELVLDDDVLEPADEALAAAEARAATDSSVATLIQALIDYATVGESIEERLAKVPGFELGWLGEARELASALNALGAPMLGRAASPQIDLRNRVMTLIDERLQRIRKVANYVFRHHPEQLRPLQSAYTRKKNLAARRRRLAKDDQDKSAS